MRGSLGYDGLKCMLVRCDVKLSSSVLPLARTCDRGQRYCSQECAAQAQTQVCARLARKIFSASAHGT